MSENKLHVAIFFWEGYLGVAPSLINAIRVLARHGYYVDVIMRSNINEEYAQPPSFPPQVQLVECKPFSLCVKKIFYVLAQYACTLKGDSKRNSKILPRKSDETFSWNWILLKLHRLFKLFMLPVDLLQFIFLGFRLTLRHRYMSFIGVDIYGLLAATAVGVAKRTPILYWSLELYFASDFKDPLRRLPKSLEKRWSRRAVLTIAQDALRADSLISENGINPEKIIIVPNAPLGRPPMRRYKYFHNKYGLPSWQRIILHIGMIAPAVLSLELARSAASWPAEWTLTLHERAKRSNSDPYIKQVEEAGQGHVLLSLNPVPYDELDVVVGSGDVGIVLYKKELGPNFAQIAGASGKLGHYLRCGLPIVCIELPGLYDIITEYKCGICVRNLEEMASALKKVFENYDEFSANAVRCYEERYEFGKYFQEVLKRIQRMEQHK